MRTLSSLLLWLLVVPFALVSCAEPERPPWPIPSQPGEPAEVLFTPGQMQVGLEWAESQILHAEEGATRIGMLVDFHAPNVPAALAGSMQVRGFDPYGNPTPWQAPEVTYNEDASVVARADVGHTIYGAQLRLPSGKLDAISNVTLAAIVPEPEYDGPALEKQTGALSLGSFVKPRSAWSAAPPKGCGQDGSKVRMAIHHSAGHASSGGSYAGRVRAIQAYHQDTRGWCDIGYHYLITDDGTVWEGRQIKYQGAHTYPHNKGNIGVNFVGCFHPGADCNKIGLMKPSQAALQAGATLLGLLSKDHGITIDNAQVKPHRGYPSTSTDCPGDYVVEKIPWLFQAAQAGETPPLDDPEPNPTPVPDPEPGPGSGRIVGVIWDLGTAAGPNDASAERLTGAVVSVADLSQSVKPVTAYWEFVVPPGTHTVQASAPGYLTGTATVSVQAGKVTWSSIGLPKAGAGVPPSGPVTFRVRSATNAPLADSVLEIGGKWFLTDATGTAAVALEGPSSVTAYADGYQRHTTTASPGAGTVDIVLGTAPKLAWVGTIQGVVWDAKVTSSPSASGAVHLDQAMIICSNGEARRARAGDAYWSFEVPPGPHTFAAIAPGYPVGQVSASVQAAGSEWASIGLGGGGQAVAPDPEPAPDPDPPPPPPPASPEVCYPGSTSAYDVCLPVVPKGSLGVSGYTYPTGMDSAQYDPPSALLDLEALDGSLKVAPNFQIEEFMQATKGRYGIYSPLTVTHWQSIRTSLGVPLQVNSGYRSPAYNSGIDGAAQFSRHMYGDAADVTASGAVSLSKIQSACYAEGADFVKVYTTHVHCDWRYDPLPAAFWGGASKPGVHPDHGEQDGPAHAWIDLPEWTPSPGDTMTIKARWEGFDEGTPWVTWRVTGPSTTFELHKSTTLRLSLPRCGDYHVRWEVGGLIDGEAVIRVDGSRADCL